MRFGTILCLTLMTSVAHAQYDDRNDCAAFWYHRNKVFQDAGYCFQTPEAIEVFRTDECQYDNIRDVPLRVAQRDLVAAIQRLEQKYGCTR